MAFLDAAVIIVGLVVFEIINSVDNSIINANILGEMGKIWRKRFLVVGILTSVFLVRFILPFIILWLSSPQLSAMDAVRSFTGTGNEATAAAVEAQKPVILIFGGVFLLYLYWHWVFLEKKYPLFLERFVKKEFGIWFFGFAAISLVVIMSLARFSPNMMIAAALGSATFFILYGFKENSEKAEKRILKGTGVGDISKFLYLEILDATFSFDGVIGAFAFTTNVIYILIGLGIGAIVVRQLTVRGIKHIGKYRWLKNGAMTSIGFLGLFMLFESFGTELPAYIPTAATFIFLGIAFYKSHIYLKSTRRNRN